MGADPLPALLTGLRALLSDVLVTGERPPDLADRLPAVVVSRQGGVELGTWQDTTADRPVLVADCYAAGLPDAFALAQRVRAAMRALAARGLTGPAQTPDEGEAQVVRRVTVSFTLTIR